jgi:tRNA pseudouridine13 synthase
LTGATLGSYRAASLEPPRAHGEPLGHAEFKVAPEDFVVEERLGFEADGGAGHVLLKVRKRGLDSLGLARELARFADVPARDVGLAGLKDRHAVTTQWFSVPARRPAADWESLEGEGFAVEAALPHSRKLKRGALRGNSFVITLREVTLPAAALAGRLQKITSLGVPNYFGPQRFGRDGSNLESITRWADSGELPWGRNGRAFVFSAARSLVFNAVLGRRVASGTWNRLLPGEYVNLAGRRSWFVAETIDATLEERLARHDIHPTGPLVGRGPGPAGEAGALEDAVVAEFAALKSRLVESGLEADRRALRLVPEGLRFTLAGSDLTVEFSLPAGAYATVVLRELVHTEPLAGEASDD